MLDKIKGGIFGVAVGDALGVSCEFMDPVQIKRMYGYVTEITGGGIFMFEEGEVSDDTEMTIAVAKGILKNSDNPIPSIGEEFIRWSDTLPKDMGIITEKVFEVYDGDWFYAAELAHRMNMGRSAGNGSLMRVLPVALFYSVLSQSIRIAHLQSKMTHHDDLASEACVLYTKIAHRLLNGESLRTSIKNEVTGTVYETVLYGEPSCDPDGYVVHTLQSVLYVLLSTNSFEEVVQTCTNNGFDADTTSAIAGGLAGIYYGFESIPKRYVDKLIKKDELLELSSNIASKRK